MLSLSLIASTFVVRTADGSSIRVTVRPRPRRISTQSRLLRKSRPRSGRRFEDEIDKATGCGAALSTLSTGKDARPTKGEIPRIAALPCIRRASASGRDPRARRRDDPLRVPFRKVCADLDRTAREAWHGHSCRGVVSMERLARPLRDESDEPPDGA